ncbi:hypothetical protein CGCVW01_v013291 [Colletotrichum viniferum]|nr:hypothetical protein CGCVW01_v013291 [Colletotrichum viniferum]
MDDLDVLAGLEEMARVSVVLNEPENAEPLPADVTNHQRDMDLKVPPEMPDHVAKLPKFGKAKYLLKLENSIDSLKDVRRLGRMTMPPEVFSGTSEDGDKTKFCKIGEESEFHILQHFRQTKPHFQPTIIRYNAADKDLLKTSVYPTLGCDVTLPQNRITGDDDKRLLPAQNEYPVWYFFYGTLADPDVLREQLGVEVNYREASIKRGVLKTWGAKYKALVDARDGNAPDSYTPIGGHRGFSVSHPGPRIFPRESHTAVNKVRLQAANCEEKKLEGKKDGNAPPVKGKAFEVMDKEMEQTLWTYETDKYKVTRCLIEMADSIDEVRGLTLRFAEEADEAE